MRRVLTSLAVLLLGVPAVGAPVDALRPGAGAWAPTPLPTSKRLSDVAVYPTDPVVRAVASLDGQVWLSIDAGERWFHVLDPLPVGLGQASTDEDIRREIQAQFEDVFGGDLDDLIEERLEEDESADPTDVEDEVIEEFRQGLEEAADQVRADLQSQPGFLFDEDDLASLQGAVASGELGAARPRVWFAPNGWLFVARADGLHVSRDLGETFEVPVERPVTGVARLGGRWVVGTYAGARASEDAASWYATSLDVPVHDLEVARGGVYAATQDGLWFSVDGEVWARRGVVDEPVYALASGEDGRLWFATSDTVFRSDDGGETAEPADEPVSRVVDLVRVGPDALLSAGRDGVWASTDGGVRWNALAAGLVETDASGLALAGDDVLLAADQGLVRLVTGADAEALDEGPSLEQVLSDWVPVENLVLAATSRDGLAGVRGRTRLASTLLPRLQVEWRRQTGDDLHWNGFSGTTRADDGVNTVFANLTWTPEGRKSGGGTVDVMIVDGEVVVDDSRDQTVVSARVGRSGTAYRQQLADEVTEIYYARARLVRQQRRGSPESIHARVDRELRIRELEARLDALTEGAVTGWSPEPARRNR